jgi:hypothetical protein
MDQNGPAGISTSPPTSLACRISSRISRTRDRGVRVAGVLPRGFRPSTHRCGPWFNPHGLTYTPCGGVSVGMLWRVVRIVMARRLLRSDGSASSPVLAAGLGVRDRSAGGIRASTTALPTICSSLLISRERCGRVRCLSVGYGRLSRPTLRCVARVEAQRGALHLLAAGRARVPLRGRQCADGPVCAPGGG